MSASFCIPELWHTRVQGLCTIDQRACRHDSRAWFPRAHWERTGPPPSVPQSVPISPRLFSSLHRASLPPLSTLLLDVLPLLSVWHLGPFCGPHSYRILTTVLLAPRPFQVTQHPFQAPCPLSACRSPVRQHPGWFAWSRPWVEAAGALLSPDPCKHSPVTIPPG